MRTLADANPTRLSKRSQDCPLTGFYCLFSVLRPPKILLIIQPVMNIKWDYSYYQPWSDNKWLVDEMIAMQEETLMVQNKDITI